MSAPHGGPTAAVGQLSVDRMVAHVSDQLRMSLGEIPTRARRSPLRYAPLKQLIIYWLPWPKGKARAPDEAFTTAPAAWGDDLRTLGALIRRFAERDPRGSWPAHPLFGRMSGRAWGVLAQRHLDHHLRQFGT